MGNVPVQFVDPDGELAFIAIVGIVVGVSGGLNLAANWKYVNSFGDGLYYFGVGAAVGAAATVGGAALAPVIGTGAIAGAAFGGAGGFATMYANTGYSTGDWGTTALKAGANGAMWGALGGAVVAGGFAGFSGNNILTGAPKGEYGVWNFRGGEFSPGKPYNIAKKDFWRYGKNLKPTIEFEQPRISTNQVEGKWEHKYVSEGRASINMPDELQYTPAQIGKKFGKHMIDYPELDYSGYLNRAQVVYKNATKIVKYPANAPVHAGETHLMYGNDLLRLDPDGFFRSLYPAAY